MDMSLREYTTIHEFVNAAIISGGILIQAHLTNSNILKTIEALT